jgi:four helix bundle protein
VGTIHRFEDLEVWRLAREQPANFQLLARETSLLSDFALKDQMNASVGSVMDCIAEGFDRSGNAEFRNFLLIAKGSNGEYRSQLHRCYDRSHLTETRYEELLQKNVVLGNKLTAFIEYLKQTSFKGQRYR